MQKKKDKALEYLLDLSGTRYVIDDMLGLWIKFEVKRVPIRDRDCGIRYSLSLHDRTNKRLMGFDNAHIVKYGGKRYVAPKKTYDHWHFDEKDKGQPYRYENAAKLLEDFWVEVEKKLETYKRIKK